MEKLEKAIKKAEIVFHVLSSLIHIKNLCCCERNKKN